MREAERAAQPETRSPDPVPRIAATLNGQPITWDDLRPTLAEAAGGVALQEVALDRLLAAETSSKGITVTPDDIAAERRLLIDTLVQEAGATPDDAERLLARVRASRGLGEVRFAHLLERNARMRKLVAPNVQISEDEVVQAFEMRHGVKYRTRVIVVPSQSRAAELRRELLTGQGDLAGRFASAAATHSTDSSAARGGLSELISPVDPAYPMAVRRSLRTSKPGELSDAIAVDRGYALVLIDQVVPPDGVIMADVADGIRAEVRVRRERLAMDDLARRLLRSANLASMDRSLGWSLRAAPLP